MRAASGHGWAQVPVRAAGSRLLWAWLTVQASTEANLSIPRIHTAEQHCCLPRISHRVVALDLIGNVSVTQALLCYCRAQSTVLSTCQPALKPTYHFSMPKLQNSTAAAQTAGTGGRRLSQSLGIFDGTQMAPAPIAPGRRRLLQTTTMSNGTQAASACNRIAYHQACGTALIYALCQFAVNIWMYAVIWLTLVTVRRFLEGLVACDGNAHLSLLPPCQARPASTLFPLETCRQSRAILPYSLLRMPPEGIQSTSSRFR